MFFAAGREKGIATWVYQGLRRKYLNVSFKNDANI